MIKSKFGIFIDIMFFSLIIFLISFFWINKFLKINSLSISLSLIISVISFIICFILSYKKRNKIIKNKKELNLFNLCKIKLKYLSIQDTFQFLEKLLSARYLGNNIFQNNNTYLYINFFNDLNCYDFIVANNFYIQTNKSISLCFLCENTTNEFNNLLKNSPVIYDIFYYTDLFEIMKNKKLYLEDIKIVEPKKKTNINFIINKIKTTLNKIKFRSTFISGLSLIILSVFVPFSLYYLITGTFLLSLSLLSIIFKSKNQNEKKYHSKTLENICK